MLPWRDVLHEGPVPAGLVPAELREVRARFLAERGWTTYDGALEDMAVRDDLLASGDELVLWFERDFYDQLQLIQVLDRLEGAPASLVAVNGAPRCPEEMIALYERRAPVTAAQVDLARRAFAAFRSPDPTGIARLIEAGAVALPDLGPALVRHLEQFPSRRNGLSRTETQLLEAAAAGAWSREDIFRSSQEPEELPFMGDATVWWYLERLQGGSVGLLDDHLALTKLGREVLAGTADAIALNGIDRWLGGVYLRGEEAAWRWDGAFLVGPT